MKSKSILVLLCVSLFGIAHIAEAQLGNNLKKLQQKAASSTKTNTTQSSASEAKPAATNPVSNSAQNAKSTLQSTQAPIYTPSAEAVKNDPNAKSEFVEEGFTRSVGQIHSGYEHLDKDVYPFAPYYKYPEYYVMHSSANSKFLEDAYNKLMDSYYKYTGNIVVEQFEAVTMPDGTEGALPIDMHVRNAYSALYLSDPSSIAAFDYACKMLLLVNVDYKMKDTYNRIVSEGVISPIYPSHFSSYQSKATDKIVQAANKYLDPEELCNYVGKLSDTAVEHFKNKDARQAFYYYKLANTVYDRVVSYHKGCSVSNEFRAQLDAKIRGLANGKTHIMAAVKEAKQAELPLPTRAQGVDNFQSTLASLAKGLYGDRYVDAYIDSPHWRTIYEGTVFYQGAWVKKIVGRYMSSTIIYKENGQLYRVGAEFTEDGTNTKWGGVYRLPLPRASNAIKVSKYPQ